MGARNCIPTKVPWACPRSPNPMIREAQRWKKWTTKFAKFWFFLFIFVLQETRTKTCARCVFVLKTFSPKHVFSCFFFASDFLSLDGGEGGTRRRSVVHYHLKCMWAWEKTRYVLRSNWRTPLGVFSFHQVQCAANRSGKGARGRGYDSTIT